MTPLLDGRRVGIGLAVVAAFAAPVSLLWPRTVDIPSIRTISATRLEPTDADPIDPALTAPLFNIARSPISSEAPQQQEAGVPAAPVPAPVLVGLVIGGHRPGVALLRFADGQTFDLRQGEEAGGWRVISVDAQGAVLEQGGRQERLALDYANKGGTASPTASSQSAAAGGQPIG